MARTTYWDNVFIALSADNSFAVATDSWQGIQNLANKGYTTYNDNTTYSSINKALLPRPDKTLTHFNRASIKIPDIYNLRVHNELIGTLGTSDYTISFWIYTPSLNTSVARTVFQIGNGSTYGITLTQAISTGLLSCSVYNTLAAQTLAFGVALTAATWTHIAITRQGTTFRAFLNGTLKDTKTITGTQTFPTTERQICIGGGTSDTTINYINSYFEDVLLANTCLYTTSFSAPSLKLSEYSATFTGSLTEDLTEFGFTAYAFDLTYGEIVGTSSNIDTAPQIFPKAFTINHSSRSEYYVMVKPNQGVPWLPGVVRALNDKVYPTTLNTGIKYYICTTAGTSGTTEPTWPSSGTVTDGSAVWLVAGDWNPGVFKGPYTREG